MRPTTGILWRGDALDLEAVYRAKLGKTIVFWGFTSTTSDMSALDAFILDDSPNRTLFSITTSLAADLGPYSAFPGEGEFLIPAGNVFEVVNVKRFSRSAPTILSDDTTSYQSPHSTNVFSYCFAYIACSSILSNFSLSFSIQQSHHSGAQSGSQSSRPTSLELPVGPALIHASCLQWLNSRLLLLL